MDEHFYVLDVASAKSGLMLWWKPNNAGYTTRLDSAGWYSKEQVEEKPGYYNNGDETLAIPVSVAKFESVHVVPSGSVVLQRMKDAMTERSKGTEPESKCGKCGHKLTLVRPGKHQCDHCEQESLDD